MPLCFVIGPIGKQGSAERKHSDLLLHSVIRPVLTAPEFAYDVKRGDEDADPGMIGDRIISDIVNAELAVADLTDLNPNAFYELGIRHSTQLPTIHMAKVGTILPFDTVSHRTIFVDLMDWHSMELARANLAASARTIRGPDYKVTNPITHANASLKMRESDDPRDQVLADIQERLGALEGATRRADLALLDDPLEAIANSLALGDTMAAVNRYREATGCGQGEALDFVEQTMVGNAAEAARIHQSASRGSPVQSERFVLNLRRAVRRAAGVASKS
jgi:hypothetical protein